MVLEVSIVTNSLDGDWLKGACGNYLGDGNAFSLEQGGSELSIYIDKIHLRFVHFTICKFCKKRIKSIAKSY